jgi:predicted acylesterase/phospholipase RssA
MRRRPWTFALLLAVAAPGHAFVPAYDKCQDRLPHTLNIGVPRFPMMSREHMQETTRHLRTVFSQIERPAEEGCRAPRAIQINIAAGNDYQLLDWIGQGLIDAAIVTDLTVSLLQRDGVPIYEIRKIGPEAEESLLPEVGTRPLAGRVRNGRLEPLSDALREYETFLDAVWRESVRTFSKSSEPRSTARPLSHELILSSHLSSPGFVWPLNRAAVFFQERLSTAGGIDDRAAFENLLWDRYFTSTRFSVECIDAGDCFAAALQRVRHGAPSRTAVPDGTTLVLFPGEDILRDAAVESPLSVHRPHLIIRSTVAATLFRVDGERFIVPARLSPQALGALLAKEIDQVPAALRSFVATEPQFGVRTYGFTVDESIRLLRQQQRDSTDKFLTLVLPGGGVKAAYQTRILDALYGNDLLRNEHAGDSGNALTVRNVIGTSGGALLGYFVAQLGSKAVPLFDVLWNKDGRPLKSTDIFGWTDLPRYVSIVVSFAIFCCLLFFASARKGVTARKFVFRGWLTLAVIPLFALAPIALQLVRPKDVEHIPEIEGIFYVVIAIFVILGDQILVVRKRTPPDAATAPNRGARLHGSDAILVGCGAGLCFAPAVFGVTDYVKFWIAFATMALVAVTGTFALIKAHGRAVARPMRRALEIVLSIAVVLFLCDRGWIFPDIHIIAGIALLVVAAVEYLYVRLGGRYFQLPLTLTAMFLIAELCLPAERVGAGLAGLLRSPTPISAGAFFLALAFICLVIGLTMAVYRSTAYSIAKPDADALGVSIAVVLIYVFLTLGSMWVLTMIVPDQVTPLELTARFWFVLIAASLLIGFALIKVLRARWLRRNSIGKVFARALPYLCGQHPNGTLVKRRYARMLVVAVIAVSWWNLVQAPALYGNRHAREYHAAAIGQFNTVRNCPPSSSCSRFTPTARFIAPANLLQKDGTRYFMFLPASDPTCPAIPNRPASGAEWFIFRGNETAGGGCRPRPTDRDIRDVAFASGSPFPVFPAHALSFVRRNAGEDDAYVDGGYSNNIPVDAARTLGAKQVLIIHSSSALTPLPDPSPVTQFVRRHVLGKLVRNVERLPGYLFERSQQVDRLSSRDMFVVSLSPSRNEKNWPLLVDFRTAVVKRMSETSIADLGRRIGLVTSWGLPSFVSRTEV